MSQICLYELWRRVDTDLPEDTATRINKAMRRVRRDDDDAAGGYLARLLADGHCAGTLQREFYLDVRMYVKRWALTWFGIDKIGGERCALLFAVELM